MVNCRDSRHTSFQGWLFEVVPVYAPGRSVARNFDWGSAMNRSICGLVVLALMVGACGQARATIVADSVSEFSGTQGANGWFYGYYDGSLASSTFKLMPNYDPNSDGSTERSQGFFDPRGMWSVQWSEGGYWTCLWTKGGVPNGTDGNWGRQQIEQWAVRRWVSDVSGPITVSGLTDPMQSARMMTYVFVDGTQVFGQQVPSSETPYTFGTTVSIGSTVDFVIAPLNHSEVDGTTEFTAVVNTIPEPSTLVLLSIGTISLLGYACRSTCRPHTGSRYHERVGVSKKSTLGSVL
jgi:hypothetical protein